MNALEFYYYNLGEEPSDIERNITSSTLNHLIDNGFTESQVMNIFKDLPAKTALTHDDLPESLWNDSLLEKDTFYYHRELHITSPAPYWNVEENKIVSVKFFLEMKIMYSIDNIISYYYKHFKKDDNFKESKKDIGTINYLLARYSRNTLIKPVDFILFLIDEAFKDNASLDDIIELKQFETVNLDRLNNKVMNATVEKINKITWR